MTKRRKRKKKNKIVGFMFGIMRFVVHYIVPMCIMFGAAAVGVLGPYKFYCNAEGYYQLPKFIISALPLALILEFLACCVAIKWVEWLRYNYIIK